MEPSFKRRKIDRRATGTLRALLQLDTKRQEPDIVVPLAPPALFVASPVSPVERDARSVPPSASPRLRGLRRRKADSSNAIVQPVYQAVDQAQPVANNVVGAAQTASNNVAPTVNSVGQQVEQAGNTVSQSLPNAGPPPTSNNLVSNVGSPSGGAPGVVQPPAAVAAAAARESALAQQEAAAAQVNPDVPSSAGPAPAKAADSRGKTGSLSSSNDREAIINPSASVQAAAKALQTPLISTAPQAARSQYPTPTPNATPIDIYSPQISSTNATSPISTPETSSSTSTLTESGSSSTLTPTSSPFSSISTTSDTLFPTPTSDLAGILASPASSFIPSALSTSAAASATVSSNGNPVFGAGVGGANPTSGGPASSTTTAASSGSAGSSPPPTGALVGGICGGVAGLVFIVAALLFLLRYRRRKYDQRRDISPPIPQSAGAGSAALGGGIMTQRSSTRSTAPIAAAANLIGRLRPGSSHTATTVSTIPSEKGFQKLSGRKLPSVLQSGGDGYGEKSATVPQVSSPPPKSIALGQSPFAGLAPSLRPPSPQRSLSGSSFYRDSHGFYGGTGLVDSTSDDGPTSSASPTSSSPTIPAGPSSAIPFASAGVPPGQSNPGVPNIRQGPARQPVIQPGGVVPLRAPSRPGTAQQRPTTSPIAEHPHLRDPLGRSRPSQDGSRQSRFRESTTPP